MDKIQLRKTLQDLELSQTTFAKLIGVTPRAVTLWLSGKRATPNPVVSYLRIFDSLPPHLRKIELENVTGKERRMREGMYGISFEGNQGVAEGVLVFENGKVYGADSGTVKYDGSYSYDSETETADVLLKVTFPPNVKSVFGISNPYEWAFDLTASFDPREESGNFKVMTPFGHTIVGRFLYLRPLPFAS